MTATCPDCWLAPTVDSEPHPTLEHTTVITKRCDSCGLERELHSGNYRGRRRYPADDLGYSTGHHPTYVRRLGDGGAVWRGL